MAKALTRQDILTASDIVREQVDVPEWGGYVYVQSLSGAERDALEAGMIDNAGKKNWEVRLNNFRARMAAMAIVDEDGTRLFDEKDVAALGKKSGAALDRIYSVAQRLSGMSDEDVEELLGNSESGPNGGSGSA